MVEEWIRINKNECLISGNSSINLEHKIKKYFDLGISVCYLNS